MENNKCCENKERQRRQFNSNYSQALPMAHKCARENIFQNKLGVPQTFLNMNMTEMHRHHKEMH